jgi:hypothetical protein
MGNHLSRNHRLCRHCYWLHGHFADHQWFRSLLLHAVRVRVQIPLYMGMGSTSSTGHWWSILPQSHQSRLCRIVCAGDLPLRIVLFGEEREQQGVCNPPGGVDDYPHRHHCKFFLPVWANIRLRSTMSSLRPTIPCSMLSHYHSLTSHTEEN